MTEGNSRRESKKVNAAENAIFGSLKTSVAIRVIKYDGAIRREAFERQRDGFLSQMSVNNDDIEAL